MQDGHVRSVMNGKRIAWLLPRIDAGGGGLQTVFRHVTHLQEMGAVCHVLTCQLGIADNAAAMGRIVRDSYQCAPDALFDVPNSGESYDVAIATLNTTVPYLFDIDAREYAYFVQDYEPFFYAAGDEYEKAAGTYRDNVHVVTIGNWLVHKLAKDHGVRARHTDFTADETLYRPLGLERKKAVCAIFQPHKPRRCHELVIDTLQLVKAISPDTAIIVYGSDRRYPFPFPVENWGLITKEECNRLYNECSVGLSISSTNPSRIPFEMMAAGLPVVDLHQDNTLWDFAPGTATLAEPNCEALATAILSYLENPGKAAAASKAGMAFMEARRGGGEVRAFAEALCAIVEGSCEGESPSVMYAAPAVKAPEEVSAVARALGRERRDGLATPPAIDCNAAYIRVGVSGLPQGVAAPDVFFNVWRDDQAHPAFIRYGAREGGPGECWTQVCASDFYNVPGLYHCQAWYQMPGTGVERCCAERSLRVGAGDAADASTQGGRWVSHRGQCELTVEFSMTPYAFNAKSFAKRLLPESGARTLKAMMAKVR